MQRHLIAVIVIVNLITRSLLYVIFITVINLSVLLQMSHFAARHAYRMFNKVRVLGAAFNY